MKKYFFFIAVILSSCYNSNAQKLSPQLFIHNYGQLINTSYCIKKRKKITVAFLGGSITNMTGWRNKVMAYFNDSFPRTEFTFINAGIPSLGSVPDAFRLQHDVLNKGKIDLMFVESAVNDLVNGTPVTQQRRALEGIVRHALRSNPYMDLILMAFVDESKIADYNAGKTPEEVALHDELARYYRLPFINLAAEVTQRIANKEFTWKDDFKSIHPSPFGQEIYFTTIKSLLSSSLRNDDIKDRVIKKLPAALEEYNYDEGIYVNVEEATNKKLFKIDTSWKPSDSANTRPGFVDIPILAGDQPGASFDFTFTGTAVGLATVSGPDAGIIKYSIDDGKEGEVDIFTKWSRDLYLPWFILLGDGLKGEKHTLHVTIANMHNENSTGAALRIAHFIVNK